jgi:hypothetical protein
LGEIKRELEKREQVYKPAVELERREVDFGSVPYVSLLAAGTLPHIALRRRS